VAFKRLKPSYLPATVITYTTQSDTLKWEVRVVFGALHQALSMTVGMAAKMANIGTGGDK
jgi:hypothetical protein